MFRPRNTLSQNRDQDLSLILALNHCVKNSAVNQFRRFLWLSTAPMLSTYPLAHFCFEREKEGIFIVLDGLLMAEVGGGRESSYSRQGVGTTGYSIGRVSVQVQPVMKPYVT